LFCLGSCGGSSCVCFFFFFFEDKTLMLPSLGTMMELGGGKNTVNDGFWFNGMRESKMQWKEN